MKDILLKILARHGISNPSDYLVSDEVMRLPVERQRIKTISREEVDTGLAKLRYL